MVTMLCIDFYNALVLKAGSCALCCRCRRAVARATAGAAPAAAAAGGGGGSGGGDAAAAVAVEATFAYSPVPPILCRTS